MGVEKVELAPGGLPHKTQPWKFLLLLLKNFSAEKDDRQAANLRGFRASVNLRFFKWNPRFYEKTQYNT